MRRAPLRSTLLSTSAMCAAVALGALTACSSGPGAEEPKSSGSDLPPIIDRAQLFGDPVVTGADLSPDGQYLAFIKPYKDVRNIWVKKLDEDFDQARPITADERPVPGFFWSRDSGRILYVQDKGGNENFHVYSVDPSAAPDPATGVPPARDLTPIDGVRAAIYSVPKNDPNTIIVGLNDRDPSYHDVYRVDITTGERTLLIKNDDKIGGYVFDDRGTARLAIRPIDGGATEILRMGEDLVPIYTTTFEEEAYPVHFHPDGKRAYLLTNKGSDVDLARLMFLDLQTGKTQLIESDPENEVDLRGALFHEQTDELLATIYIGHDRTRIYPKTDQAQRDFEILRAKFPTENIRLTSSTEDMQLMLFSVSSDVDPGSTYLYNRDTGAIELVYRSRPDLPSEHLAPMKPVRYKARDGLEIPAYLTVPKGVEAKKLPTVLFVHGGPWARDTWGYDPYAQFLANRGYAVLQPNFRSSDGYGKSFLNAGSRTWGTGAAQHDLTDGVEWLIEQGIADRDKVCIFGGSYGGYATLAGVTFTPDLYACGIPYVAPSNLITLIESFPAYWKPFLEGSWYKRWGDPANPADREDLESRSPLNFVDRIKVPLLVVHGANDPRVTQPESDRIVVALRDKGHAVEYIVAPDEGHGFRAPGNRMALAVAIEQFLAKHLGGRTQTEVPADVAKRLVEITVDISTVTEPSAADEALAKKAMTAPLPKAEGLIIKPVTLDYKAKAVMGQMNMDIDLTRKIEAVVDKDKKLLRITDSANMSVGKASDSLTVDRETLRPRKRTMSGMAVGELDYSDEAVRGEMQVMGRTTKIDVPLDAPVLADGPGLVITVAGLPLAEGYRTTLRQLDNTTQKVEPYELVVTGTETVEVKAGSFETYVVELRPLSSTGTAGTMWVTKQRPHLPVKGKYDLPASMGGGTLTTELVKKTGAFPI